MMVEEGGLKEKIRRAQNGSAEPLGEPEEGLQGLEAGDESKVTETEGEEEDPKQDAVNLLLGGKLTVAAISAQTGLPASVVGGLKGGLLKKGYLTSEKTAAGLPPEPKKQSSPEDEMRQEMLSVLKEELSMTPGIGEQGLAYILKRFASDEDLGLDPNKLHFMIARHAPRMDDFDVKDVVERVFKVTETYHLDRLRGMRQFPGYRTGSRSNTGFPGYNGGPQTYPYGPQEQRLYSDADVASERRLWSLENRIERIDSGLEGINKGLVDMNRKLDEKPKTSIEDESVKRLEDKNERLQEDLAKKDREIAAEKEARLNEKIDDLRGDIKSLHANMSDLGTVVNAATDVVKEVLREAPGAKVAANLAAAMGYGGRPPEPPAEARKTILESLKEQGMTVPE